MATCKQMFPGATIEPKQTGLSNGVYTSWMKGSNPISPECVHIVKVAFENTSDAAFFKLKYAEYIINQNDLIGNFREQVESPEVM